MVGWHHLLNGHEFKQTLGDSERQGGLACCSPWVCKESDRTERLNNNFILFVGDFPDLILAHRGKYCSFMFCLQNKIYIFKI